MRAILVMGFAATLLSGCTWIGTMWGDEKPVDAAAKPALTPEQQEARRQQLCADPKWKEAHLGLWYEVCRRNVMR